MNGPLCVSVAALLALSAPLAAQEGGRNAAAISEIATEDSPAHGLYVTRVNKQRSFSATLPAGNYSGITHLARNKFAIVDDKSVEDGFRMVEMRFNKKTGAIKTVEDNGFISSALPSLDAEAICYNPVTGTLFIAHEADNSILEYNLASQSTGRAIPVSDILPANGNAGLESLCSGTDGYMWTCTEAPLPDDQPHTIRIQRYSPEFEDAGQWLYQIDKPSVDDPSGIFVHGVSELCSFDDERILVLERESSVPSGGIGAYVINKIYVVIPETTSMGQMLDKQLLISFRTSLTVIKDRSYANYEGMCVGPEMADGTCLLILVSDSQEQYLGILSDWFTSLKIAKKH